MDFPWVPNNVNTCLLLVGFFTSTAVIACIRYKHHRWVFNATSIKNSDQNIINVRFVFEWITFSVMYLILRYGRIFTNPPTYTSGILISNNPAMCLLQFICLNHWKDFVIHPIYINLQYSLYTQKKMYISTHML